MGIKIVSWDGKAINDGTNYVAWFPADNNPRGLPEIRARMIPRTGYWPVLGSIERPTHKIVFKIRIQGAAKDTLRTQLFKWFRPIPPLTNYPDQPVKRFVVEDDDGSNTRYVEAIRVGPLFPDAMDGADTVFTAILEVSGDVAWRRITNASFATWNLASDSGVNVLTPDSQDIVHPIIDLTPRASKSGSYAYRRFIPVHWPEDDAGGQLYPFDICNDAFDTAALVSGGKMQADGDDLRVFVNGIERDRWLDGINTSTTKVWVNFDFLPDVAMTLAAAIAGSGSVDTITVNEDLAQIYAPGIVKIDSEYFQFTGKINSTDTHILTGVTRAAHGSSIASHTVGTAVTWLQNEIYIVYGNSSATAPVTDDRYKPAFNLATSTNTSWDYDDFGETQATGLRAASWIKGSGGGNPSFYNGNRGATANPWAEIGVRIPCRIGGPPQSGHWQLYNPCGITHANFQNGEKRAENDMSAGSLLVRGLSAGSGWQVEYTIPSPSTLNAWESWSQNIALAETRIVVSMWLILAPTLTAVGSWYLEAADVTLTLDSTKTPTTSIGAEQGGYLLDVTLTNLAIQGSNGGLQLKVKFLMELNQTLRIDTYDKTVTYLKDGSSQVQAIDLLGVIRHDWWPMEGGEANSVSAADDGTTDLDIDISYTPRYLT